MGNISQFRRGQSTYICECCGRRTRETFNGTGDYCEQCEELLMLQNSFWDGVFVAAVDTLEVSMAKMWYATIEQRGGDMTKVRSWCKDLLEEIGI